MKVEEMDKLLNDIEKVAVQFGVKNWAFAGENNKGIFVGLMQKKRTQGAYMLSIINVGRLWQHARSTCRTLLNSYEHMP